MTKDTLSKEELLKIAKREFVTVKTVQRWVRENGIEYARNRRATTASVRSKKNKNKSPWRNFIINPETHKERN